MKSAGDKEKRTEEISMKMEKLISAGSKMMTLFRLGSTAFFLLMAFSMRAQTELPPFMKTEYNKIVYPGDSTDMLGLFQKIDELQLNKRKKVTIVHYGGSHVEAGHWDEVFQEHLQNTITRFEGGGVWAFPFKLAKANSPPFYKTYSNGIWHRCRSIGKENCSVFGMNGITANTSERVNDFAIALAPNFHHNHFTSLKVYHNFNPAYHFHIDVNSGLRYKQTQVRREGYTLFEFEQPTDSVNFLLEKTDTLAATEFTLYGFSLETNEAGFYYADMGFNGAATKSYIDAELFVPQLRTLKPDLVIFSIGVNDSQGPNFNKQDFTTNYDTLVARVRRASPGCAILFTTVTDNYVRRRTPNKKALIAHEAILDLAKKHNAGYWDMFMLMGGFKSMAQWTKANLAAKDKVHFTIRGYHIMGNLMFDAFYRSYNNNTLLKRK